MPQNDPHRRPLRIVLAGRGDHTEGGESRVAEQLNRGLSSRGHQVTHFVRRRVLPSYSDHSTLLPSIPGDTFLRNLLALDPSGLQLLLRPEVRRADIIHFHGHIVGYGGLAALLIARFKPTLFTFHDYSGFTGGCFVPNGCTRFRNGCGECPLIGQWPMLLPKDRTRFHFKLNEVIAASPTAHAVSPSRFVAQRAQEGAWQGRCVHHIPNAVDTNTFHPNLRVQGQKSLKLPAGATALVFVAADINAQHKGFDDLAKAFCKLASHNPSLHLVVVGKADRLTPQLDPVREQVRMVGFVEGSEQLASIYAACDCLVCPTRGDNFPLTILEAMSTGTPTIAYPTGGIPEMLESSPAGWVTERLDAESLTETIAKHLPHLNQPESSQSLRSHALASHSLPVFLGRHEDLYRNMLGY